MRTATREARRRAIAGIRFAFIPPRPRPAYAVALLGLGRRVTARLGDGVRRWGATGPFPPAPRGWIHMKELHRNSVMEVPLWLSPVAYLYLYGWQGVVFEPLIRLGLWRVREDGGYYIDGEWTLPVWIRRAWWAFLRDRDTAPPACPLCGRLLVVSAAIPGGFGCRPCSWRRPPRWARG